MNESNPHQWPPLDRDGRIVWPDDRADRVRLARRLLGEAIVGRADTAIEGAYDLITNPEPSDPYPHENYASALDRAYRDCFSSLTDRQRQIILRFARNRINDVVFSILCGLAQFGVEGDRVEIFLTGTGPDGERLDVPITDETGIEFHEMYIEWQGEFGKHDQELVNDLLKPP